ncbi:MAG: SCO family protein [Gammaproteobacteria bacterium]|nr:SCO family protein [Gammaproteobacteria bacterium]
MDRLLGLVAVAVLLAATPILSQLVMAEQSEVADRATYLLGKPKVLTPFRLMDQGSRTFDRQRLMGKWSLVFFGYTSCPDICPTALAILKAVFAGFRDQPEIKQDLQGIFISVDPKRDKPETLKEYVAYFNPDFIGLTGEVEQVDKVAHQMGAKYSYLYSWESEGDYTVNHTATLFVIDPQARIYAAFPPPYGAGEISEGIQAIRKAYTANGSPRVP